MYLHHKCSASQFLVPGQVGKPPPVNVSTLTSTGVLLSWSPPADHNGVITMYRINVQAISSDPAGFAMGMGGGVGDRRRRRQTLGVMDMVVTSCISGGEDFVERNFTTDGDQTLYLLDDLSKFEHSVAMSKHGDVPNKSGYVGMAVEQSIPPMT